MPDFTHHVFVCGNAREEGHKRGSCDPKGKQTLRAAFKRELKRAGYTGLARINQAGCLDQCEHGPVVVIYPHAIWYGNVKPDDVGRIVSETLVAGRPVPELLIAPDCLNNPDCPHRRPSTAKSKGEAADA